MSVGIKPPDLPVVDLSIPVATLDGYARLPYEPPPVVDDGTWGLEDDSWDPEVDGKGAIW